jgi:hypothetical protein
MPLKITSPPRLLPALCILLLMLAGCAQLPQKSGVVFAPPGRNYMVVNADTLNLRRCPDASCQVMVLLYRGETVAVRRQQGLWSEIETRTGTLGWVASRYLDDYQGKPPTATGIMPAMPEEELALPAPGNPPEIADELADPATLPTPAASQPPEISEEFSQ